MQTGPFVQQLFSFEPPPGALQLRSPLSVHAAILRQNGSVYCGGKTVSGLSALPALCRALLDAGHSNAALQVRTSRGEPVCFVGSIADVAATDDKGAASTQLDFGFGA